MKSNSVIDFDFNQAQLKKLDKKLENLGKAGRNAVKQAAIVSFQVINKENQRLIKSQQWRTKQYRTPGMRQTAAKASGYRSQFTPKKAADYFRARTFYNYKHKEMQHAHFVELGVGYFDGYRLRHKAFRATVGKAQALYVKALKIAIRLARKHPTGKVPMKALRGKLKK